MRNQAHSLVYMNLLTQVISPLFSHTSSNKISKLLTPRGVSHCGLPNYIKKYLKAKEELWKLKYFTMQKYNLQKNPLIETKSFKIS